MDLWHTVSNHDYWAQMTKNLMVETDIYQSNKTKDFGNKRIILQFFAWSQISSPDNNHIVSEKKPKRLESLLDGFGLTVKNVGRTYFYDFIKTHFCKTAILCPKIVLKNSKFWKIDKIVNFNFTISFLWLFWIFNCFINENCRLLTVLDAKIQTNHKNEKGKSQ